MFLLPGPIIISFCKTLHLQLENNTYSKWRCECLFFRCPVGIAAARHGTVNSLQLLPLTKNVVLSVLDSICVSTRKCSGMSCIVCNPYLWTFDVDVRYIYSYNLNVLWNGFQGCNFLPCLVDWGFQLGNVCLSLCEWSVAIDLCVVYDRGAWLDRLKINKHVAVNFCWRSW